MLTVSASSSYYLKTWRMVPRRIRSACGTPFGLARNLANFLPLPGSWAPGPQTKVAIYPFAPPATKSRLENITRIISAAVPLCETDAQPAPPKTAVFRRALPAPDVKRRTIANHFICPLYCHIPWRDSRELFFNIGRIPSRRPVQWCRCLWRENLFAYRRMHGAFLSHQKSVPPCTLPAPAQSGGDALRRDAARPPRNPHRVADLRHHVMVVRIAHIPPTHRPRRYGRGAACSIFARWRRRERPAGTFDPAPPRLHIGAG